MHALTVDRYEVFQVNEKEKLTPSDRHLHRRHLHRHGHGRHLRGHGRHGHGRRDRHGPHESVRHLRRPCSSELRSLPLVRLPIPELQRVSSFKDYERAAKLDHSQLIQLERPPLPLHPRRIVPIASGRSRRSWLDFLPPQPTGR